MVSPMDVARNLAQSPDIKDRVLGVAMLARGYSDDEPEKFKQGWPVSTSIDVAIQQLGTESDPSFIHLVKDTMPTISDAMLGYGPRD